MRTQSKESRIILVLTGSAILSIACKDSNNIAGTPAASTPVPTAIRTATPTPIPPTMTPTPLGSIAGSWTGQATKFDFDAWDGCIHSSAVQATFDQTGSSVTGTFLFGCFKNMTLQGTLQSEILQGTIQFTAYGNMPYAGAASGNASSSQMTIHVPTLTAPDHSTIDGFDLELTR